jgi:hypothetical protein
MLPTMADFNKTSGKATKATDSLTIRCLWADLGTPEYEEKCSTAKFGILISRCTQEKVTGEGATGVSSVC